MFFKCCCIKKKRKSLSSKKLIINNNVLLSIDNYDLFSEECSICLEPLVKEKCIYAEKCYHIFHHDCLINYLRHKENNNEELYCPMCYQKQYNLLN